MNLPFDFRAGRDYLTLAAPNLKLGAAEIGIFKASRFSELLFDDSLLLGDRDCCVVEDYF